MLTPYDWQEGIGHRLSYVRSRLGAGTPVLMLSVKEGILAFALRRQANKIYEIYDRLLFGAIGQQSDVEALRVSAIEFAHQEGYNRSEQDVTIARVVSALSTPMKRAFADFNTVPFVVQAVFAEVAESPDEDQFYYLDVDGDFSVHRGCGFLVGNEEATNLVYEGLNDLLKKKLNQDQALPELKKLWAKAMDSEKSFEELSKDLTLEIALLSRDPNRESRFIRY